MPSFAPILARAEARKGAAAALSALLPTVPPAEALRALPDDRVLAEMTRRIVSAGFVWSVIETKWPGFEAAFLGFDIPRLVFEPDEFLEWLIADTRIVRNAAKIMAVRANARFVQDIAAEHGSFGRFLADWPATDLIGLVDLLGKRGNRLGGATGQYFLRCVGKDSFILNQDLVACLRDAGLDIAPSPTSKRDLKGNPGAVQRVGRGDRAALYAPVPHLCHVDRRESRTPPGRQHAMTSRTPRCRRVPARRRA